MVLALDSSTLTLSLALVERVGDPAALIDAETFGPPLKQSELLPGAIERLLVRHRVALRELEGIVVGLGPGSFTGLRIGLATVKALAYAARLRVAGASSLAAVAMEGPPGLLRPAAVARQGELYVGRYMRTAEGVDAIGPERAMTPESFGRELHDEPEARALGPAVEPYRDALVRAGAAAKQLSPAGALPLAAALARLGRLPAEYDARALFALEPHYVRASEAERNPKFPPLAGPPPEARIRPD
jgi:tRNA threonylcarbamoyladenosine biosynthesis protein TsaB